MSAQTIVVDPVTRIEGHLRIEAQFDGSVITQASSSGTMVRGIEIILQGRDPRDAWAFAQRICGVCTLVHGIASVRAVEDALHYAIPANAQLIRNLMIATQFVHDHVMHFYHLHALDWVDVVSALKADPKATSALAQSISNYARSSPGYFAEVQTRVKKLVESGQLGIFSNAYWGHPGYKLPPEANLRWRGSARLCNFRPSSAAKIRTPMCWWAAPLPPSVSMPVPGPVPPPSTKSACKRWPTLSSRCATSSTRCTSRTHWRLPLSTKTGSRPATARAPGIS
jgi:Ni,Fe-hydrogenase I large subunit